MTTPSINSKTLNLIVEMLGSVSIFDSLTTSLSSNRHEVDLLESMNISSLDLSRKILVNSLKVLAATCLKNASKRIITMERKQL